VATANDGEKQKRAEVKEGGRKNKEEQKAGLGGGENGGVRTVEVEKRRRD